MAAYSHLKFELRIEELLNHTLNKYQYHGESGKEYEVIQSIFSHLNNVTENRNMHIRWYAVVIHLWRGFRDRRLNWQCSDFFRPMELTNVSPAQAYFKEEERGKFQVPLCIEELESFIDRIARLGILASAGEKIDNDFFNLKLENINNALLGLLNCLKTSPDLHPDNDVFWLAINHAAVKIIKLVDYNGKDAQTRLSQTIKSENFQKFVRQPVEKMSAERKQSLYNLNDFWNGLIP